MEGARVRVARAVEGAKAGAMLLAPGRINLIGDHIDYVGGTVLPMSIDRGTWFAFESRTEAVVELRALDRDATITLAPEAVRLRPEPDAQDEDWECFLRGLLALGPPGDEAAGLRITVAGDLHGGGLSSSASYCVGLAQVLSAAGVLAEQTSVERAHLAREVEHRYVGVACGLMDQLAVALGLEDGAMELDCATGAATPLPLAWGPRVLLALRTRTDRQLASGGYNTRREELAAGLARLAVAPDAIPHAEVLPEQVDAKDLPLRRVRHVVSEQARVRAAVVAARSGDWAGFGAAMTASHVSLRDDYDVSTPELDRIVDAALAVDGCDGARLTGAGFGGWAIALVDETAVPAVLEAVAAATGREPTADDWFLARPGGAARLLEATDAR